MRLEIIGSCWLCLTTPTVGAILNWTEHEIQFYSIVFPHYLPPGPSVFFQDCGENSWFCSAASARILTKPCCQITVLDITAVVVELLSRVWLFCDLMDTSLPDSSVCGISQGKILKWVAVFFSRGSSWPKGWTWVPCLTDGFFTTEPTGKLAYQ